MDRVLTEARGTGSVQRASLQTVESNRKILFENQMPEFHPLLPTAYKRMIEELG